MRLDTSWVSHSWVHLAALAFHFNLIIFMFYWLLEINVSVMCSDNLYSIYSIFSCLYKRVIRDLTCINMTIEIWIFPFSTQLFIWLCKDLRLCFVYDIISFMSSEVLKGKKIVKSYKKMNSCISEILTKRAMKFGRNVS